jgi:hypothetical protein
MFTDIMTKKYDLGDIFKAGWQFFWSQIKVIVPIILCVYIPINIILSFVPMDWITENFGAVRAFQLYSNITRALEGLIGIIAYIALANVIEKNLQGQDLTWSQALRLGISKWGWAVLTNILGNLIIVGLSFLLIVPGIIWAIYYTFMVYVVALRSLGGKPALNYSKDLVKGQWWHTFGILLVIGLVDLVVVGGLGLVFGLISSNSIYLVITDSLLDLISALIIVFQIVFFLNTDYLKHPVPGSTISETLDSSLAPAVS